MLLSLSLLCVLLRILIKIQSPFGAGSYLKNSYEYKNITSIFLFRNILAFLYNSEGFLLVLIRNEYIMKTIVLLFLK